MQFLAQSVREVLLVLLLAHVDKRQDRDGLLRDRTLGGRAGLNGRCRGLRTSCEPLRQPQLVHGKVADADDRDCRDQQQDTLR